MSNPDMFMVFLHILILVLLVVSLMGDSNRGAVIALIHELIREWIAIQPGEDEPPKQE